MATEVDRKPRWQYYLNPWWTDRRLYFSKFTSDECRRILNESTTRFIGGPVKRSLFRTGDFSLERVSFMRNSFKPTANVRLSEAPAGGTFVTITLCVSGYTQAFLILWFGFIAVWIALASTAIGSNGFSGVLFPLFGLAMAGFGFALNAFGRVVSGGDSDYLVNFLKEQLKLSQPPESALSIG